jgi:hypothetical protein
VGEGESDVGSVGIDFSDCTFNASYTQTATAIVNAIPAVIDHAPGMVAAFDLPKISGKGLYRG